MPGPNLSSSSPFRMQMNKIKMHQQGSSFLEIKMIFNPGWILYQFRERNELTKEPEVCYSMHQGGPGRYLGDGESTIASASGSEPLGWVISAYLIKAHLKQK